MFDSSGVQENLPSLPPRPTLPSKITSTRGNRAFDSNGVQNNPPVLPPKRTLPPKDTSMPPSGALSGSQVSRYREPNNANNPPELQSSPLPSDNAKHRSSRSQSARYHDFPRTYRAGILKKDFDISPSCNLQKFTEVRCPKRLLLCVPYLAGIIQSRLVPGEAFPKNINPLICRGKICCNRLIKTTC